MDGKPLALLSAVFLPPENNTPWDKEHGQLVRRRIKTAEPSPEDIGLCGCWRIAAVERVSIDLTKPRSQQLPVTEIAYYVDSRTKDELNDENMLEPSSATGTPSKTEPIACAT